MKKIQIYCDGGSVNNGHAKANKEAYGAYASVILSSKNNKPQKTFTEVIKDATNNQMELQGAIVPLTYLNEYMRKHHSGEKLKVIVTSDSQYLVKGANEWMKGWIKRGWTNSSGKVIENLEMWKVIHKLMNSKNLLIEFRWVRGHKGKQISIDEDRDSYFNELCDSILTEELSPYR